MLMPFTPVPFNYVFNYVPESDVNAARQKFRVPMLLNEHASRNVTVDTCHALQLHLEPRRNVRKQRIWDSISPSCYPSPEPHLLCERIGSSRIACAFEHFHLLR